MGEKEDCRQTARRRLTGLACLVPTRSLFDGSLHLLHDHFVRWEFECARWSDLAAGPDERAVGFVGGRSERDFKTLRTRLRRIHDRRHTEVRTERRKHASRVTTVHVAGVAVLDVNGQRRQSRVARDSSGSRNGRWSRSLHNISRRRGGGRLFGVVRGGGCSSLLCSTRRLFLGRGSALAARRGDRSRMGGGCRRLHLEAVLGEAYRSILMSVLISQGERIIL